MNLSALLSHIERMAIVTVSLLAGISLIGMGWLAKAPYAGAFRNVLDSRGVPVLDEKGIPKLEFVPPSLLSNFSHDLIPSLITLAGVACILSGVLKVIRDAGLLSSGWKVVSKRGIAANG